MSAAMTATPTLGDLSARHVEVLREMFAAAANERRMKEADALAYAIAALSALPAAGGAWQPITSVPRDGTRVVVWMPDGTFSSASYSAHSEPQGVYWMIPTTPQPSAAEGECTNCGRPKRADRAIDACACASLTYTPPPVAAVGAQGEVLEMRLCEVPYVILHRDRLYRFTVDPNCEKCRDAASTHGAAPAAGKGVDDAMVERACAESWPEARFTVEAMTDWPHADPLRRGHHQRVVRAALEAALTRQPAITTYS